MNDIKNCAPILQHHLEYINSNDCKEIVESIIGDMLMNKVKIVNEKLQVNINNKIITLIKNWYNLAEKLQITRDNTMFSSQFLTIYRGIYNISESLKNIIQPIPFSTSLEKSYCYEWINNHTNSFIMKINIPIISLYTFIGNKNEGFEVILPAGLLKRKYYDYEEYYENKKIIEYDFEYINFLEMSKMLDIIKVDSNF